MIYAMDMGVSLMQAWNAIKASRQTLTLTFDLKVQVVDRSKGLLT